MKWASELFLSVLLVCKNNDATTNWRKQTVFISNDLMSNIRKHVETQNRYHAGILRKPNANTKQRSKRYHAGRVAVDQKHGRKGASSPLEHLYPNIKASPFCRCFAGGKKDPFWRMKFYCWLVFSSFGCSFLRL